jgi:hypothetical protein
MFLYMATEAGHIVTIEEYCEDLTRLLYSQRDTFKTAMQNVVHSMDYATAIASLLREVLSNDLERKLWVHSLGLLYCVFILPSELFITPVKSVFSTDTWEMDNRPSDTLVGPESHWVNSFFARHSLSNGVIQIHFVGGKRPISTSPKFRNRGQNVFIVDDDFLNYLHEWDDEVDDKGNQYDLDTTDIRFRAFLSQNRRAVERIFGVKGLLKEFAPSYCRAIIELESVTCQRRHRGQHVYLVPGHEDAVYPGVFCFLFQHQLSSRHRVLLRIFCDHLFGLLRSGERSELQRRNVLLHGQLAARQSDFHTVRTVLGTLSNTLHTMRLEGTRKATSESAAYISEALQCHAELLGYVDKLETHAISATKSFGPIFSLITLSNHWRSEWNLLTDWKMTLARENTDLPFELPGPVLDIGQVIYQFLEGVPIRPDKTGQNHQMQEQDLDDNTPSLYMSLDIADSSLFLMIDTGSKLPFPLEGAVRSMNIMGHLPSQKHKGGRGILSAISMIRNRYRGSCQFLNSASEGASWMVSIPVAVVRQYRLFNQTQLQGDDQ